MSEQPSIIRPLSGRKTDAQASYAKAVYAYKRLFTFALLVGGFLLILSYSSMIDVNATTFTDDFANLNNWNTANAPSSSVSNNVLYTGNYYIYSKTAYIPTGTFDIEYDYKGQGYTGGVMLFDSPSMNRYETLYADEAGNNNGNVITHPPGAIYSFGPSIFSPNNWYHMRWYANATGVYLWVNGTYMGSAPAFSVSSPFYIAIGMSGSYHYGYFANFYYNDQGFQADFTSNVTSGTAPLIVQFNDTSIGNVSSWNWSFGDGTYSTMQNATHAYTTQGRYTVTLTVSGLENSNTLTSTLTKQNYISIPVPYIYDSCNNLNNWTQYLNDSKDQVTVVNDTSINSSVFYFNSQVGGSTSGISSMNLTTPCNFSLDFYVKYTASISQATDNFYFLIKNASNPNQYEEVLDQWGYPAMYFYVGATNGSTKSSSWNYETKAIPKINGYIHYTLNRTGNILTFSDGANQFSYVEPSGYGMVTSNGLIQIYIQGNGVYQEAAYVSNITYQDTPLTANFTSNVTVGATPLTVQFNDTSVGSPTNWSWDFGDDMNNSAVRNATHTYTTPGVYNVTLTVNSSFNYSSTLTKSNYINVTGMSSANKLYLNVEYQNTIWTNNSTPIHIRVADNNNMPTYANVMLNINGTSTNVYSSDYVYYFNTPNIGEYPLEVTASQGAISAEPYYGKIQAVGPLSYVLLLNYDNYITTKNEIDIAVTNASTVLAYETVSRMVDPAGDLMISKPINAITPAQADMYNRIMRAEGYTNPPDFPSVNKVFTDAVKKAAKDCIKDPVNYALHSILVDKIKESMYSQPEMISIGQRVDQEGIRFSEEISSNSDLFLKNEDDIKTLFVDSREPIKNVRYDYKLDGVTTFDTILKWSQDIKDFVTESWFTVLICVVVLIVIVVAVAAISILTAPVAVSVEGTVVVAGGGAIISGSMTSIISCITVVLGSTLGYMAIISVLVSILAVYAVPAVSSEIACQYELCNHNIVDSLTASPGGVSLSATGGTVGTSAVLQSNYNSFVVAPDGSIIGFFKDRTAYKTYDPGQYKVYSYAPANDKLLGNVMATSFNATTPDIIMNVSCEASGSNAIINTTVTNMGMTTCGNLTYMVSIEDDNNTLKYYDVYPFDLNPGESRNVARSVVLGTGAYSTSEVLTLNGLYVLQEEHIPVSIGGAPITNVYIRNDSIQDLYSPFTNVTFSVTLESYSEQYVTLSVPEFDYAKNVVVNGATTTDIILPVLSPGSYDVILSVANSTNTSIKYDSKLKRFMVSAVDVGTITLNTSSVFYQPNETIDVNMTLRNMSLAYIDANVSLKVTDPSGNVALVSTIKNSDLYSANYTPVTNGTYVFTSVVDKPGYRFYYDTMYIIVGEMSRLNVTSTTVNDTIIVSFYANGALTSCNATIMYNNTTETLYVPAGGQLYFDGNGTISVVANRMMFEPAYITVVRPVASVNATQLSNTTFRFDASSSYAPTGLNITQYAWDFGDHQNMSGTMPMVTHTYTRPGTYYVTLRVTDTTDLTGKTIENITIPIENMLNAVIVNDTIPLSINSNQTYNVSITTMNAGIMNWSDDLGINLNYVNTSDNFSNIGPEIISIAPGIVVGPSQDYTFNFTILAPATGTYNLSYTMEWYDQDFGQAFNKSVNAISTSQPNAQYLSDTIPGDMSAGQSYQVSVTMLNNGTMNWTNASGIMLGGYNSDAAQFNVSWVTMPDNIIVIPGQNYTFRFNMSAPNSSDIYYPVFGLYQDKHDWFGERLNKSVVVTAGSAGVPDAVIVSDTIPSSMVAGQTYDVSVTLSNTGTMAWSEDDLIRLGAYGDTPSDSWLFGTTRVYIPAGTTVNPGEQYTFSFTMTAPSAGTYNPIYQMVWEGHEWFGDQLNTNIDVSAPLVNAEITSTTIPGSMEAGSSYDVSVTVMNMGSLPWNESSMFRLGMVDDESGDAYLFNGSTARVWLPDGANVLPGESVTFNFAMKTQLAPGTYHPSYQMVWENYEWFGEISTTTVVVSGPDAVIVSNTIPSSMTAGHQYPVSVTVQNTGSMAWNETNMFRLGMVGDESGDAYLFDGTTARVWLPDGANVLPGESVTFTYTMTAPPASAYHPEYQMVWENHEWFGQQLNKTVNVIIPLMPTPTPTPIPVLDAQYSSSTILSNMSAGQSYQVSVTMLNNGTMNWTNASGIMLGGYNSDAAQFNVSWVTMPDNIIVIPGQNYTFDFNMTAPIFNGTYYPVLQMYGEGAGWFGQQMNKTIMVV